MRLNIKCQIERLVLWGACLSLMAVAGDVSAGGGGAISLGGMASNVTSSFASLAKLITAGSYIAGLGFFLGAIMKFKQHKDNPSQTPIGVPMTHLSIAAALVFLPSILGIAGQTLLGSSGSVAGPSGVIFGS